MRSSTEPRTARTCRCGAPFPLDRASQARYHSDACAAAHRKRRERASEEFCAFIDSIEKDAQAIADARAEQRPEPAPPSDCDHCGQQPWREGNWVICWRCGDRLSPKRLLASRTTARVLDAFGLEQAVA